MSGSGRRAPAALLATSAPIALGAILVGAAGIGAAALLGGDGDDGRPSLRTGGRTVAVTRQTLVERETVQGTLGYAGSRTVLNRLGGSSSSDTSSPSADSPSTSPAALFTPAEEEPASENPPAGEDPTPDEPADDGPAPDKPADDAPAAPEDLADDDASADDERSGDDSPAEAPTQGSGGDAPEDDPPAGGNGSGSGTGTVTALPRPGSVVRRGGVLYRVDGRPVVLMYGSTPAYRDLGLGVTDGPDVRQLELNLAALGFYPGAVDDNFTSSTAAAVTDWQEAAGLPETGSVELGRVVFLPGARRIGELKTAVGHVLGAGAEVLETSSTRRVVTVELDAALQSLARKGQGVEVTLPDQSTVRGRITEVGGVAREKEGSGADSGTDPGAEQELVIDVTVRLRSARGLGRLDEAPVSVGLAQETRRNALAVPVNALVARRGGGYGVELDAGRRIVPVRTGLFAGGYVELAGAGIRAGTRVVVPDA